MRETWFVVEVYCALHLVLGPSFLKLGLGSPRALAVYFGSLAVTLLLAALTFKGVRLASRALAVIIAAVPGLWVWATLLDGGFNAFVAYGVLCVGYFFLGAIKLWRIKELPTRFTDPPAEPPAHA